MRRRDRSLYIRLPSSLHSHCLNVGDPSYTEFCCVASKDHTVCGIHLPATCDGPKFGMDRSRQSPTEFLAQVLNRRGGPDDLPYSNEAVWTIRQHLLDTVQVLDRRFELNDTWTFPMSTEHFVRVLTLLN